ncbi:MAG: hypothetical protein CVU19_11205 [Betaproteobacteria bacterium HGW-Betaproteobacteria-13]|uniref:Uncharacterized protein n=1 Tax=Parazoarcus communis TaxID=41977 RepID=A0A2U8HAK2_9RHOO|nr:hypothetical protein CEW87_18425 [Parazoarcus communis]PKO80656.1 MAG: hypothetical protein CVU19_11205 [Betaproteobacteria bacterium HGW-Betaproteobacteria-13]
MLILFMTFIAILSGAATGVPEWIGGVAAWGAVALMWAGLHRRQRRVALLLIIIGVAALVWSGLQSGQWPWTGVLTKNIALLGMLAGVSFLQLLGLGEAGEAPRGPGALWRTIAGVHAFGAVINLSAVFIMGDRMGGGKSPSIVQLNALTRGFLGGALWSPFFAATAVALTYAPGATLAELAAAGIPLALVMIVLAARDLLRDPALGRDFVGYPMRPAALWVPALLALMVIVGHWLVPSWSTLAVVTFAAPVMAVTVLIVRAGVVEGGTQMARHVVRRLPAMRGEMSLFLAAAVFATGLDALIASSGGWLPMAHVGAPQAALVLAGMIFLCVLGIHAVISIATVAAWLAPLNPDPVLMAVVYVQCWAIGLAASPMSGIHLALQGRYGVSGGELARGNVRYSLQAYVAAVVVLFIVAWWRGL